MVCWNSSKVLDPSTRCVGFCCDNQTKQWRNFHENCCWRNRFSAQQQDFQNSHPVGHRIAHARCNIKCRISLPREFCRTWCSQVVPSPPDNGHTCLPSRNLDSSRCDMRRYPVGDQRRCHGNMRYYIRLANRLDSLRMSHSLSQCTAEHTSRRLAPQSCVDICNLVFCHRQLVHSPLDRCTAWFQDREIENSLRHQTLEWNDCRSSV